MGDETTVVLPLGNDYRPIPEGAFWVGGSGSSLTGAGGAK
jgi:hypothetical protein